MSYSKNIFKFFKTTYETHMKSKRLSRSTVSSYRRAFREFKKWNRDNEQPEKIKKITQAQLYQFRDHVAAEATNATANARVGRVCTVLRYSSELGLRKQAITIRKLDTIPFINKLTARFSTRDESELLSFVGPLDKENAELRQEAIERDELSKLYLAAGKYPRWPYDDNQINSLNWRALIVVLGSLGLRTGEAVRMESSQGGEPLSWKHVHFEPELPGITQAKAKYGWITFCPNKQSRHKSDPVVIPMSRAVRTHLEALPNKSGPIFDWPKSKEIFYSTFRMIFERAGLPEEFKIKHLRKTAATWANYYVPGIGKHILGHSARGDVHEGHYNNRQFALVDAIENQIPTPYAWRSKA